MIEHISGQWSKSKDSLELALLSLRVVQALTPLAFSPCKIWVLPHLLKKKKITWLHLREASYKGSLKWWAQNLIMNTARNHFHKVTTGVTPLLLLCQRVSCPWLKEADIYTWFMIWHSQRDRNLPGYESETQQMEMECGRSIAVGLCPNGSRLCTPSLCWSLGGSCVQKYGAHLYMTKPASFGSPRKEQKVKLKVRNLWDNNKSVNQLFCEKMMNNNFVPFEQCYWFL